MPFTGTAVVKQVADNLVRVTGLSLAGGATGTIGLSTTNTPLVPQVLLPAGFQPKKYVNTEGEPVSLQDSIEVRVVPDAAVASAVPVTVIKTGTKLTDFLILFGNSTTGAGSLLGRAVGFAVLAGSTIASTLATTITGDLGLSPGATVTGFPPGTVSGTQHINDAAAANAQYDAMAAYQAFQALEGAVDLSGQDLGGMTLTPGVYKFSSAAQLTGVLTLNAGGDPNAIFVFQIGTTLTTAAGASVVLAGSAQPGAVFWQVGSSATLAANTVFKGTILALANITINTGTSFNRGRALALTGSVTFVNNGQGINSVTLPDASGPAVASPELEIYVRFH